MTGSVLDVASGSGYGSDYLRQHGCDVTSVDIDAGAAAKGRRALQASGEMLPFRSASFDSITSIETIEHVVHPTMFLDELHRVLRPGGLLVLTTPNARYTKPVNGIPANSFHLREWHPEEFLDLVGDRFGTLEVLGQDLSDHVKVSPFYVDQQEERSGRSRATVVLWRVLHKLPPKIHDPVSRRLWGHTLHLRDSDYTFSPELARDGRVLVVHGRRP